MEKVTIIKSIKSWIGAHKVEFAILLLILIVASFMRLYRIGDYMTFLGDEGRDVIIVRRFLKEGDIMLIGPGTSIGNMYLGPLYYYLMAPALLLAGYSPVGPAVMVALFGIATVALLWWVGRSWFSPLAGLLAAAAYSIAPTVVIYSRSSWNPNIMPFFALLAVWSIWKFTYEKNYKWIIVCFISVAFALQSHYLGLILGPVLAVPWVLALLWNKKDWKRIIGMTILGFLTFALLMSPLVIFDIRHGFRNFESAKLFFTHRQTTVSIRPWSVLPEVWPLFEKITSRMLGGHNAEIGKWFSFGLLAGTAVLFLGKRFKLELRSKYSLLFLSLWVVTSLVGLALYKQEIYDHYYGFFFPALFLLMGGILSMIQRRYKVRGLWAVAFVFIIFVWVNLESSPLKYGPNKQYGRSKEVAEKILTEANGKPFNFAVVAERNYEGAYQYFLDEDESFRVIDPQNLKDTLTEQLFVACELPKEKCDPAHNPKAEIANFGWSKIDTSWDVSGVVLFKLIHAK